MDLPEYVVVGHATRDIDGSGFKPGGTVTFAALAAQKLGWRVGVVTSATAGLNLNAVLPGICLKRIESPVDTTFENVYYPEGRIQFLRSRAEPIGLEDIPSSWLAAPIFHFGPVADEVDFAIIEQVRSNIIGVTPQGWLRKWEKDGRIRYRQQELPPRLLERVSAIVLSEEDVAGDPSFIDRCLGKVGALVLTCGARGARVYAEGEWRESSAYSVNAVDPTGAGDVFAAAYFIALAEKQNPFAAARFANSAASFVVEKPGLEGIAARAQILDRINNKGV